MSLNSGDFIPKIEALILLWLQNFITVANANIASIGLTAAQIVALNDLFTDFSVAYGNQQAARNVAKGATGTKTEAMVLAIAKARELVKIVQAHPGVTTALRQELQITVPEPLPAPPVNPLSPPDLNATLDSVGWVTLKWDRGGNKPGTNYILEMREGSTGPFLFVASVMRPRYIDKNRAPGVKVEYRVHAVRRGISSAYSPTATIYAEGWQTPSLQIAA